MPIFTCSCQNLLWVWYENLWHEQCALLYNLLNLNLKSPEENQQHYFLPVAKISNRSALSGAGRLSNRLQVAGLQKSATGWQSQKLQIDQNIGSQKYWDRFRNHRKLPTANLPSNSSSWSTAYKCVILHRVRAKRVLWVFLLKSFLQTYTDIKRQYRCLEEYSLREAVKKMFFRNIS